MSNLFGSSMPTLYANGETTSFAMPTADKDGRNIFFRKITKTWTDFNGVIHERIKGYQLTGNFVWSEIDASDLDNLIQFMNIPGQKFIKFSTLPRKYPFIIDEFEPGLQYGYDLGDSARLSILGTHLVQRLPSIDEAYTIVCQLYRLLNTT